MAISIPKTRTKINDLKADLVTLKFTISRLEDLVGELNIAYNSRVFG